MRPRAQASCRSCRRATTSRRPGRGSVGSPGATPEAITVGAVTTARGAPDDVVAGFSSSGPTPLSLRLADVSAPGVAIFSAAPRGAYTTLSGTSMAAPHAAGAAALLLQRHSTWTPAQVKSALTLTGSPAFATELKAEETPTLRGGGGVIGLPRADTTPLFAAPRRARSACLVPIRARRGRSS